jgi:hypothetical protein
LFQIKNKEKQPNWPTIEDLLPVELGVQMGLDIRKRIATGIVDLALFPHVLMLITAEYDGRFLTA